jgi:hypothetical protein
MCGGTIVVAVMFGKSRKGKTTALRKYKTREIGIVINWRRPVGGGLCIGRRVVVRNMKKTKESPR